jgi:hypothetical protein
MSYQPRRVAFLEREGRLKHYGIGVGDEAARPELAAAVKAAAADVVPGDTAGFTIAHDARFGALGIVYWWANENELHARMFAAPREDPGALEPADGTGLACVWELEVIDFERRAWLEDVLKDGDVERYLGRSLEPVLV